MPSYLKTTAFYTAFALTLGGCASGGKVVDRLPDAPVVAAEKPLTACRTWSRQLNGHISHVSTSGRGSLVLVSTSAEGRHNGFVRLLDGTGKTLWSQSLIQPVKSQDLADDGSLFVLNTYDGQLRAYRATPSPRPIWTKEHLGRPVVLEGARRIILLNDDDSEPRVAFVSYDYAGKQRGTARIDEGEPVDLFIGEDEQSVLVTISDGSVRAFDLDGKQLWRLPPGHDGISVSAGQTPDPFLVVLNAPESGSATGQAVTAFDPASLEKKWRTNIKGRFEIVRRVGPNLIAYGNSSTGQSVSGLNLQTGQLQWNYSYSTPANYSSAIFTGKRPEPHLVIALDTAAPAGVITITAVSEAGRALWEIPVEAASGIFSYAVSRGSTAVVVGAGDPGKGTVHYYRVGPHGCR